MSFKNGRFFYSAIHRNTCSTARNWKEPTTPNDLTHRDTMVILKIASSLLRLF